MFLMLDIHIFCTYNSVVFPLFMFHYFMKSVAPWPVRDLKAKTTNKQHSAYARHRTYTTASPGRVENKPALPLP